MSQLTHHAVIRMQQRGINAVTVDYLLAYGDERRANGGAILVYFDKDTKKKLFSQLEKAERLKLEHHLNSYLILGDDGNVVTVGHRTRRMMKH